MRSGNMDGLFQVEGALYVSLFARLPPPQVRRHRRLHRAEPSRPLESGMVDDYVKVASGKTPVHYYDERLRPILEETYGTMVYQEQIMQISMAMSGFSAGKADKAAQGHGQEKSSTSCALCRRTGTAAPWRTATLSRSPSRFGRTRRSSLSTRSTSRTPPRTPSWSCARRI